MSVSHNCINLNFRLCIDFRVSFFRFAYLWTNYLVAVTFLATESSGSRTKDSISFGPPLPDDVLDDLCFRFLINIPEDQVIYTLSLKRILLLIDKISVLAFACMISIVFWRR